MNRNRASLAILAADLIATALLFSRLPEQVPVHWNLHAEADRFGSRWELVLIGPGLIALLWALTVFLRRIDPLASQPLPADAPASEHGAFDVLVLSILALGAAAHIFLLMVLGGIVPPGTPLASIGGRLFAPAMFIIIGNFLPRVRPNYFAGLRTPWTLSSPTVWRRSNRLAGKLMVAAGVLCAAFAFVPGAFGVIAYAAVIIAAIGVPIVASYLFWRAEKEGRA